MRVPILVVGAGLAGLSTAHHLAKRGARFRHVERAAAAGGHATTTLDEGFRFDKTGHLLHLRDPEIRSLVLDLLGDDHVVVQRRSLVYSQGVYTRYPYQANTFGLPPETAYECVLGFLRRDTTITPRTFEDFCLAHFGEGFSKHFMLPYNGRLFGVPPRELSTTWCDRFVPKPTLEDVLAGAVGLNDRELGYNASFVYPRLGIGRLAEALAAACPPIETSRSLASVSLKRRTATVDDEEIPFDALVSTLPLKALAEKVVDLPADLRGAARALRATSLSYFDVALARPPAKAFHWVYVPEPRFPFYRVGAYSAFSPSMAPEGCGSLYVELAERDVVFDDAWPRVLAGLVEMGVTRAEDVIFARLRRLDPAYVVFDDARDEATAKLLAHLEAHGVSSIGRYGKWTYASMEDALQDGRDAARRLG